VGDQQGAAARRPGTAPGATGGGSGPAATADLFTRCAHGYAADRPGEPLAVLYAGAATARDIGLTALAAGGTDVRVRLIDEDHPAARAVTGDAGLGDLVDGPATWGDLRTIPLAPRSFGIVLCSGLLERVHHAELVLDRLVAALKPGGLLLLGTSGRAARFPGARPGAARGPRWPRRRVGTGAPPAFRRVSGPLVSPAGLRGYLSQRGLVIVASDERNGPGTDRIQLVARKAEDPFARVIGGGTGRRQPPTA